MNPRRENRKQELTRDNEVKISLNYDTCVASGNCGYIAPDVFQNLAEHDGFVSLRDKHPPESEWQAARRAGRLCPSATIFINEEAATERG